MTDKGIEIGVVKIKREKIWKLKKQELENSYKIIENLIAKPGKLKKYDLPFTRTGRPRSPKDILSSGKYSLRDLYEIWPDLKKIPINLHTQIQTDCIYDVYLKRQKEDIKIYQQENKN